MERFNRSVVTVLEVKNDSLIIWCGASNIDLVHTSGISAIGRELVQSIILPRNANVDALCDRELEILVDEVHGAIKGIRLIDGTPDLVFS